MSLKRPVSVAAAKRWPAAAKRRKSFCERMGGMRRKLTSEETASDPNSRINRALAAWDCDDPTLLPRSAVSRRIRNPYNEEDEMDDFDQGDYGDNPTGRKVQLIQRGGRGRNTNPVKMPFKYVALVDQGGMQYGADSRTSQAWLFTVARPGKTSSDWQGNRVKVYNWFRLPVALTYSQDFQQWVADNHRWAYASKVELERTLRQFMGQ